MKPLCFLLVILFLVSAPVDAQRDSLGSTKPYGIKSCKIVYQFFNGPQCGIKTFIFDDWGTKEKIEAVTTNDTAMVRRIYSDMLRGIEKSSLRSRLEDSARQGLRQVVNQGIPAVQHQLQMHFEGETYDIDLDKNIGYKTVRVKIPPEYLGIDEPEVVIGNDTILGKPCRIVDIDHVFRIWYWGKIALKKLLVQEIGMRMEEYAISIDENYPIAPDEFKVPASVKMQ